MTTEEKTVAETRAPDWGFVILGLASLLAAQAVASALGFTPERTYGALETKQLEGLLDTVLAPDISKQLVTWAGYGSAGISALFVVWAGVMVPREKSLVVSVSVGLIVMASLLLAWFSSGQGLLAGVTTGVVMFLSALAARQSGTVKAVGMMVGTLYFLFAILGIVSGLSGPDEAWRIIELSGLGTLVGIGILIALHLINLASGYRLILDREPAAKHRDDVADDARSFFAPGPGMTYAIVRAVLLGIGMGLYQADQNTTVFWAMLAIWVVLQPVAAATWERALKRGLGILAGCLVVGVLSQFVSGATLIWIAFGLLFVGLSYYRRSYAIYQACMSMLVVTIYGDVSGAGILHWAALRIGDNAIGIVIALVVTYVIFPRDREEDPDTAAPSASS